jgi:hypothetical protein
MSLRRGKVNLSERAWLASPRMVERSDWAACNLKRVYEKDFIGMYRTSGFAQPASLKTLAVEPPEWMDDQKSLNTAAVLS